MRLVNSRLGRIAVPLLAIALVAGCSSSGSAGSGDSSAGSASSSSKPTVPASLVLDYTPNGTHSQIYVAKDKGYFAENGLDLTIEPGTGSTVGI